MCWLCAGYVPVMCQLCVDCALSVKALLVEGPKCCFPVGPRHIPNRIDTVCVHAQLLAGLCGYVLGAVLAAVCSLLAGIGICSCHVLGHVLSAYVSV